MLQRTLIDAPPLTPVQRLAAGVLSQLIADVRRSRHQRTHWKTYVDTESARVWADVAGLPFDRLLASAARHFRRPSPPPDIS